MEQQRLHQEDRVRRALERAQAEPKKKVHFLAKTLTLGNQKQEDLDVLHMFFKIMHALNVIVKIFQNGIKPYS